MANSRVEHLRDGLAELVLCRPPVNALTPAFLDELEAQVDELTSDPGVRAVLIRSDGGALSAGMDLKAAQAFEREEEEHAARAFTTTFRKLYALPKPVVCAVAGPAIAGGFFFVLAADIRLATPAASFGLAEIRVGATLPVGPLEIARAELRASVFRRLLLTGLPVDAEVARAAGIVDLIVHDRQLLDTARTQALRLAEVLPEAYARTKADMRRPALQAIDAAIAAGAHDAGKGWFLQGTREAMKAMLRD